MEVWEVRGHHHAIRAVFIGADQYDSGETPPTEVKGHRTGTSMYVVIVQSECSTHAPPRPPHYNTRTQIVSVLLRGTTFLPLILAYHYFDRTSYKSYMCTVVAVPL